MRPDAIDRYAKSNDANKTATLTTAEERARRDHQDDARLAAIQGLAQIDYAGREQFLGDLAIGRGEHFADERRVGVVVCHQVDEGLFQRVQPTLLDR